MALFSFSKKRETKFLLGGGGHMYNVAILEADQNQANKLKAFIGRNM